MTLTIAIILFTLAFFITQFFNKNYKNIFIVDFNIIITLLSIFLLVITYGKRYIIPIFIIDIIILILIVWFLTSYIKIESDFVVVKNGFFSKRKIITFKDIKEIKVNNEISSDGSSFFIYFITNENKIFKYTLIYRFINKFLKMIKRKNNQIIINNKNKTFFIIYVINLLISYTLSVITIYSIF